MKAQSILHFLLRLVRCKSSEERRHLWRIYAFEHLLKMPVVFTDRQDLRYALYPGQNAQVYFENQGNYEVAETAFCTNFVRPDMVAFDVGANIGLYTLLFAKLAGAKGRVHAFEPERRNFQRLLTNLALNGFQNVLLHQYAVFSESRNLQLNVFPDSVNAWHSLGRPTLPDPYHPGQTLAPSEQQEVHGVSLDDYCTSSNVKQIDLLKVDVEGAELEVLQGAMGLLRSKAIAAVMFEVSLPQVQAMGHEPADIFALMKDVGLHLFSLSADGSLVPWEENDQARYQNFVALRDEEVARRLVKLT